LPNASPARLRRSEVGGGNQVGVVGGFEGEALGLHAVLDGATELHASLIFELAAGLAIHLELGVVDMAGHLASPKA